jgi:hypothetical protein
VLRHYLDYDRSALFQHFYTIGKDPLTHYRKNMSQVVINDKGCVKLCYVENLPFVDKPNQSMNSENQDSVEEEVIQCRLNGSIFTPVEGEFGMTIQNFTQIFDFPKDAQTKIETLVETQKHTLDMKINSIRASQSRMPKSLFDYSQYENAIEDLLALEGKSTTDVYAGVYGENLVVVYSGQYVKYGKLIPKKKTKK